MDWNYPGFTACLVSALVLSVVLLFGDCLEWCPFRGFHRSPFPCYGNSTPGSAPLQLQSSVCTSKVLLLGESDLPMAVKALTCLGAEFPQSLWDPRTTTTCCQGYEPCELWHLIPEARLALGVGNRPLWLSLWDFDHLCHFSLHIIVFR